MRFIDWPFHKDESVALHWLRSPQPFGKYKQWRMHAVFRQENGTLRDVPVPWGALPSLRLGSVFRDGAPTGERRIGTPMRVRFGASPRISICSAISVPRFYELKTKLNLQEKCLHVWTGGEQILVPCLELIRAYFALNRMMASELLRPDSFNDVCTAGLDGEEARLEFTARAAALSLSPEVVKRIALVLLEKDFMESWRQVWASAVRLVAPDTVNLLSVEPPALPGSVWDAVGVVCGNTTLVLEIRNFTPAVAPPFSKVCYSHPGFREYQGGRKGSGGEGEGRTLEEPEEIGVDPLPKSPKGLTAPRTVKIDFTSACFRESIELVKIKESVHGDSTEGDRATGGGVHREKTPEVEGSLYEEAGYGEIPSLEFTLFESLDDVLPPFQKLFKALNHIPQAILSYCGGSAPDGSALPTLPKSTGTPRPYALVCVSTPWRRFYLLEVDTSDRHEVSTLVFIGASEDTSVVTLAEAILKKGVAHGGNWERDKLRSLLGRNFQLVKHTRSPVRNWGARLLKAGQWVSPGIRFPSGQ